MTGDVRNEEDVLIEVAEHPVKYSLQGVKEFGNNVINNASVKQSFTMMKENMKAIIGARQACLDNELAYRTYKKQAVDGINKISDPVITPTRECAAKAITSIMDKANEGYREFLKKSAEGIVMFTTPAKWMLMVREINTFGAYSRGSLKTPYTKDHMSKRINYIENKLKDVNIGSLKEAILLKERERLVDLVDFVESGKLHDKVWGVGKKSPADKFYDALQAVKQAGINGMNRLKSIPPQVIAFLNTAGTTIKESVLKACENVVNLAVHMQNKYMDFKRDAAVDLSKKVVNLSTFTAKKQVSLQKVLKSSEFSKFSNTNAVNKSQNMIKDIKSGKIAPDAYMSAQTKAVKQDMEAVKGMHNSEAAILSQIVLNKMIDKDKDAVIKELKDNVRTSSKKSLQSGVSVNVSKAASAITTQMDSLANKLNNVLLRAGASNAQRKWKEVSFTEKTPDVLNLSAKEIKALVDEGKNVDFNRCTPDQLTQLSDQFGMEFEMTSDGISLADNSVVME